MYNLTNFLYNDDWIIICVQQCYKIEWSIKLILKNYWKNVWHKIQNIQLFLHYVVNKAIIQYNKRDLKKVENSYMKSREKGEPPPPLLCTPLKTVSPPLIPNECELCCTRYARAAITRVKSPMFGTRCTQYFVQLPQAEIRFRSELPKRNYRYLHRLTDCQLQFRGYLLLCRRAIHTFRNIYSLP